MLSNHNVEVMLRGASIINNLVEITFMNGNTEHGTVHDRGEYLVLELVDASTIVLKPAQIADVEVIDA